jgi:hypothetical protein
MRTRAIFVVAAALVLCAAALLSQQVLYERLVVPHLAGIQEVPIAWWLGVAAPVLVTGVLLGCLARSWPEALLVAALGALGLHVYGQWLAESGRPGWHKNLAVEAPLEYWTLGLVQVFLVLAVLTFTGRAWRKTRAAS